MRLFRKFLIFVYTIMSLYFIIEGDILLTLIFLNTIKILMLESRVYDEL